MTNTMDQRRLQFICTLYQLSESGRAHLLGVESDAELADLKRVALDSQHFEMAASIVREVKRRTSEISIGHDQAAAESWDAQREAIAQNLTVEGGKIVPKK